jgi:hypothetical protein
MEILKESNSIKVKMSYSLKNLNTLKNLLIFSHD